MKIMTMDTSTQVAKDTLLPYLIIRILAVFFLFPAIPLSAQWINTGNGTIPKDYHSNDIKIAPDGSVWSAAGSNTGPPEGLPHVARSANQGMTWDTTSIVTDTAEWAYFIAPIDSMNAWVSTKYGGLFRTVDGGLTWNKDTIFSYLPYILYFFDADNGFVGGFDPSDNSSYNCVTSDGGSTWTVIPFSGPTPPGTSMPTFDPDEDLSYTSWTSGGSVDFTDSAIVIASSRGYWLSKDRGYNWERKPTPLRANNRIPVSVAMKDPDHILILSDWDTVFNFYPQPLCFTTSDGGQTWGQSNVPVSTSFTRYVSGTSNTYITVGFISISGPSGSAISYDGGLSWNTLTGDSYTSVAFLNDSTGYATASNGSFGTNNQGQIYKWDVNCFATSTVENVTVCDSFTWPTTGITYITSGTYADTIQNGFGCDSILVLNLEIAAPVVNVFRNGNTFIAEDLPVSTMHQWLRCDQGFAPINGANTNVYTATEDGQYAVEFTNGSCKDTSECFTACMPLEDSIVQVDDTLMVTTVGATYQWVDCDNGNAPITGATERKYVPMSSGNFGVEISGTLCTYTLDCYNIILSGAEETETKRVRIHPNPVTHWLNIEGDLSNTHTYELYNTMGQMVGSGLIHQQRIDVKDLSGGMYLLRIRNANRVLLGTYQMIKR